MSFRRLCAAAAAALSIGLAAASAAAAPAAGGEQLGTAISHEVFQIIDFGKLIAQGAGASISKSDFLADVRPEWPQLFLDAMSEEVQQDGPAMERMFGAILAKNFSAGELQAGLTILSDPQFKAILVAQYRKQPPPSTPSPCGPACMSAMQSADGRAFMEKFGKLGDILDKRAQREFAAILLPGVFRRFGEKAEAAERARAK